MRLKALLWPRPAAAAGAPGVPGFPVGAVPPDDGGQAAGAVPAGMTSEVEVLRALKSVRAPQGPGREGTSPPAVLVFYTCCLVRWIMHIFMYLVEFRAS